MPRMDMNGQGQQPPSGAKDEARLWREYYDAYLDEGFDSEQAFSLTLTQAEAVWSAGQEHHYDVHGCPLCTAEMGY